MRKIVLLFFVMFLFIKVNAQNIIVGMVTDTNNLPLLGTSVGLPELNKGTTTNNSGEYIINNVPNGEITIQFSYIGYNTQIKTISITQAKTTVDITLTRSVIETQKVVITSGYINSQHENAVKIDVLTSKDISLSGTPNFMEAITQIPGIDMISKGQGVSKPVIRGLSMNDILVMNNGIRIENYQFSENHPLGIDENDVERIEVIKGPASVLYGSDAIGGVINFIKEKPAPANKILGDYSLAMHSNTRGLNSSLGIKGASKNFFAGIRFSGKTHADYLQGGGNYVPNSRFNELTFNTNIGYSGKRGSYKVFYDYFKQDLGMSVAPAIPLVSEKSRKTNIWYQNLEHHLLSSQNSIYLGKFKLDINTAYQKAIRKLITTLDVPFVEMNLNTITYDSKLHFPHSKKSDYIIGIQGMLQNNKNLNNRASQFLPNAYVNNIGLLMMGQHTFFKKLKLQSGLRFDMYHTQTFALGTEGTTTYQPPINKNYSNINGSIGTTYMLKNKTIFRANFAKGYRVPNLSELTSNGMHGNRYEIGNNDLSPENSYQTDASIHYHGDFLSFDLAGFYNDIKNYIFIAKTTEQTTSGLDIYSFSQTDAKLYGGEAGIHFHPKSLPFIHIQGTYSSVIGKQSNGDYLPYIPAHKIRYEIRIERKKLGFLINPNIKISALSAFSQDKTAFYETTTEKYTLINVSAYCETFISQQKIILGLSVNNLFDIQYYDHLSTLKSLNFYNQGRNISLLLKLPIIIK